MELVTGHQAGPHITAAQVSRFIQGITVMDDTTVYRLNEGNKCAITTTDLNLTIDTGEMVLHGFHVTNETAYDIGIDPVSNASNTRIDKIVLEITEDITTGIQNASVVVVQGTEAVSPVPPATPSTPSSPTELFLGVGVIAQITATDSIISVLTDLTELYAGSYVSKEDFDTGMSNVAPIENTNTASQPYSVGGHLIYNGILYKVDANIAQGATLVPGGNISLSPDVEAQIGALNSALTPQAVTGITTSGTATTSANYSAYRTGNVVQIGGYFTGTWGSGGTVLKNLPAPKDSDNKVRFTARNGSNSSTVDVYFVGNDLCVTPSCTALNFNITYIAQ